MKRIEIEITGVAPLLQNRFDTENYGENKSKSKKKVYNPKEEAATKEGIIAVNTYDMKMRWENGAKLFNPDIKLISVWETQL